MAHISWTFVIIELSTDFLSFPGDDFVRLCHKIHEYDMKVEP